MTGLAEFLAARLDEDEAIAAGADIGEWHREAHAERHNPARVLREAEAKRAILAQHWPDEWGCQTCQGDMVCPVLHLAAVYSGHADYRQEWKP